jgi:hypothetical protein
LKRATRGEEGGERPTCLIYSKTRYSYLKLLLEKNALPCKNCNVALISGTTLAGLSMSWFTGLKSTINLPKQLDLAVDIK